MTDAARVERLVAAFGVAIPFAAIADSGLPLTAQRYHYWWTTPARAGARALAAMSLRASWDRGASLVRLRPVDVRDMAPAPRVATGDAVAVGESWRAEYAGILTRDELAAGLVVEVADGVALVEFCGGGLRLRLSVTHLTAAEESRKEMTA